MIGSDAQSSDNLNPPLSAILLFISTASRRPCYIIYTVSRAANMEIYFHRQQQQELIFRARYMRNGKM